MKKTLHLIFLLAAICCGRAGAQITFQTLPAANPYFNGRVSAIGDVNGDQLEDVVVATGHPYNNQVHVYSIRVYLQNGLGGLLPGVNYPYHSATNQFGDVTGIDIADINNDGKNDVVFCYSDSLCLLKQNGAGGFLPMERIYSGPGVAGCKSGDLNNDGLADVVLTHSTTNGSFIRVFLQTAAGFTSVAYPAIPGNNTQELEIADLTGDGRHDVALMGGLGNGGNLYIYAQTPGGTLAPYVYYPTPPTNGWNLRGIEVADVNTDGLTDVIGTRGSYYNYSLVTWLQDPVTHLLQTPTEVSLAPAITFPIEAAMLNCDNSPDIVTAGSGGLGALTVITNDSSEGYSVDTSFAITNVSGLQPQALSIGDFTGDGKKDVAIADFNFGVVLLKNTTSGGPAGTLYIVTIDTLSTTSATQSFYFNTASSYNSNGYAVTRTDSFRVDVDTRRDSLRIDSTIILNAFCHAHPDTFYTTHYITGFFTDYDTTLLGTRWDSLSLHTGTIAGLHGVHVYPNPGKGIIRITADAGLESVALFSLTGQRVEAVLRRDINGAVDADLRAHPAGIYLVQVRLKGGGTQTVRVVKE